jgi:hypothetical protein
VRCDEYLRLSCARKAPTDLAVKATIRTHGGICIPQEVCLNYDSKQFARIFCSQLENDSIFPQLCILSIQH